MDTTAFIDALPKAELHLHLEGALPWALKRALSPDHLPEEPAWWAADYRFANWGAFEAAMSIGGGWALQTLDHYHDAARQIFASLAAQNVRYAEISFGPELTLSRGLAVAEVATVIRDALPEGMAGAVFCGINRRQSYELDDTLIEAVFAAPIDGIDLHGRETPLSARPFGAIYAAAGERGLMTKAHAGELLGPQSVYDALDYLNVTRIEHGARAVEDDDLVQRLADEGVTLDLCPTSNLKLRVVEDLAEHPIKALFERGVNVTVSTDDPAIFGCSLTSELQLLVDDMGFSLAEVAAIQKNAFHLARMADEMKTTVFVEIDALVSRL